MKRLSNNPFLRHFFHFQVYQYFLRFLDIPEVFGLVFVQVFVVGETFYSSTKCRILWSFVCVFNAERNFFNLPAIGQIGIALFENKVLRSQWTWVKVFSFVNVGLGNDDLLKKGSIIFKEKKFNTEAFVVLVMILSLILPPTHSVLIWGAFPKRLLIIRSANLCYHFYWLVYCLNAFDQVVNKLFAKQGFVILLKRGFLFQRCCLFCAGCSCHTKSAFFSPLERNCIAALSNKYHSFFKQL